MKKVSIRSTAHNEFVAYIGNTRETTFSSQWDALEWLWKHYAKGHLISSSSNYTVADLEGHTGKQWNN